MAAVPYVIAFLPSFAWLFFFEEEDAHPEPKGLLAFTFIMGGVFTILALVVQLFLRDSGAIAYLENFAGYLTVSGTSFLALLALALTEELAKFAAAYFTVYRSRHFDEPVDAMVYMVVAALGFAAVENIAVLHGSFSDQTVMAGVLGITSVRFVGATLLHALTSAFVGYYWAVSIKSGGESRFIYFGLALAAVLHAGFNYLILNNENLVLAVILLVIAGFFALGDFEELEGETQ